MKMPKTIHALEPVDDLGLAFLGLQLYQLLAIINIQGNELLGENDSELPSGLSSTIMLLHKKGPLSVTELGNMLNMSHQLMGHRIRPLKSLKMIEEFRDPKDGRKVLFNLTSSGRASVKKLEKVMSMAEQAYTDLFTELDIDLYDALKKAKRALIEKPIKQRIG